MQKYSIINERDTKAIDIVLDKAFDEYMKNSGEKWAGFESADAMKNDMKIGAHSLDDWVNMGCWEEYISSSGAKTGCYEEDITCRGCCFRNISYACFFKKTTSAKNCAESMARR